MGSPEGRGALGRHRYAGGGSGGRLRPINFLPARACFYLGIRFPIGCALIIRLIIQTIRQDPSGTVWTDEAPNVSRPDPSGADQTDAEHQATDLAVGGSNPRGAHNAPGQRPGAVCFACLVIISVPRGGGSRSLLAIKKRGNRWWVVVYAAREPLTGRKRQTRDREPAGPAGAAPSGPGEAAGGAGSRSAASPLTAGRRPVLAATTGRRPDGIRRRLPTGSELGVGGLGRRRPLRTDRTRLLTGHHIHEAAAVAAVG